MSISTCPQPLFRLLALWLFAKQVSAQIQTQNRAEPVEEEGGGDRDKGGPQG